jgi:hypothetical protein
MATKQTLAALIAVAALPSHASAACPVPGFKYAAFGNQSMQVNGGASTNSYDSSAGTYAQTNSLSGGNLGTNATSNGAISVNGGSIVSGNIDIGFGGNPNTGITVGNNSSVQSKSSLSAPITLTPVTVPSLTNAARSVVSGTLLTKVRQHLVQQQPTSTSRRHLRDIVCLSGQCDLIVGSPSRSTSPEPRCT